MKLREATLQDMPELKDMALKYEIDFPEDARILIAENDEGEIKAFAALRPMVQITPFISENPLIGKKLFDHMQDYLQSFHYPMVQCFTDPENKDLFTKLGFQQVFDDKIIMEKIIIHQ